MEPNETESAFTKLNNSVTNKIDILFKNFQRSNLNESNSSNANAPKKASSPATSPPLLLLPNKTEAINDESAEIKPITKMETEISLKSFEKQIALIETNDNAEMSLIVNLIKAKFPKVNIHMCSNNKQQSQDRNSLSPNTNTALKTNSRNCLSASFFSDRKNNDRAASIDNSSLSSNTNSIERQESKDSGFWSMSKCSFESMKSLSISDTPNQLEIAAAIANATLNNNKTAPNPTPANIPNEAARKYLTSPTNLITKSPLYNWKKWKKGQAWRYNVSNSSSNVSESDNTNDTSCNESSNHSSINNKSFDSASFAPNGVISENEPPQNNLVQTQTPYFSNSFESNKTSFITINQPASMHMWASTSQLEQMGSQMSDCNSGELNEPNPLKAQKRRGKLVRDRTIDNYDEQSASFNNLNGSNSNSTIKLNESNKISIGSMSPFHKLSTESNTSTNSRLNEGSLSPLSGSSAYLNKEEATMAKQQTGRVSPPEKRFSLSTQQFMNDNEEVPQQPYVFSSPEQQKINLIVSQILNAKYLNPSMINEEMIKQIASQIKPSYARSPNESVSASTSPSPSLSASSNSSATLFGSSSQTLSNSLSQQSSLSSSIQNIIISSNENTSVNQYDFYKDLQAKLNLKNDNDEARKSPKHSRMHHLNRNGVFKPSQVGDLGKNADKHLNSSSFEIKSGNYLSNPSINNNNTLSFSNQPGSTPSSSSTSKIICRSNSSPSYSSSSSSSSSPNPGQTGPTTQNSLTPYNSVNSSSINLGQAQPMTTQSAFIFKSSSCSLPVSSPTSGTTPATSHVEGGGACQPFGAYFANEMSMNRKLLAKPPEIVITESKPDNEQVDYEIEQANFDYQNKKIEPFHINKNDTNKMIKDDASKFGTNFFSLSNRQPNMGLLNKANDNNELKSGNNSAGSNPTANTINVNDENEKRLSQFENILKKSQATGVNIFDSWKLNNPIFNFNYLKTNNNTNTNAANSQANNSNNPNFNSFLANSNNNNNNANSKLAKVIKPHICPSCQKRFARSDMLIRHSRLHSGIRPYRCNRCGQEFSRSDHLNTHLRTHTGEKPYSCPHPKCTYAACRKDMITRHLKVHTKNRLPLSFDADKLPDSGISANTSSTSTKFNSFSAINFENLKSFQSVNPVASNSFDSSTFNNS